ncbi:MAG TPA: hypothetical protein VLH84_06205, partial [Patescibacteria group bacterium]|nr:hypothetical protein [Patescibacteria group bacterium]
MIRVHISRLFTKLTSFTAVCLLMGMFAFAAVLPVTSVYAATAPVTAPTCTAGKTGTTETPCIGLPPEATKDKSASNNCTADCGLVAKYAIPFINFLAAMVGVVVTISIVIGGIQYTTSRDNP